jgi:hypothetical protein
MAEPCKCGNKPSAYMKGEKCIHKLSGYQLLTKDVTPYIRIMGMVANKRHHCTACPRNQMPEHNVSLLTASNLSVGDTDSPLPKRKCIFMQAVLSLHMQYAVVTENFKPNTLYAPNPPCVPMSWCRENLTTSFTFILMY